MASNSSVTINHQGFDLCQQFARREISVQEWVVQACKLRNTDYPHELTLMADLQPAMKQRFTSFMLDSQAKLPINDAPMHQLIARLTKVTEAMVCEAVAERIQSAQRPVDRARLPAEPVPAQMFPSPRPSYLSIGDEVKQIRTQLGLSQTELALRIGVSPAAIGSWENDRNRPHASSLEKLRGLVQPKHPSALPLVSPQPVTPVVADRSVADNVVPFAKRDEVELESPGPPVTIAASAEHDDVGQKPQSVSSTQLYLWFNSEELQQIMLQLDPEATGFSFSFSGKHGHQVHVCLVAPETAS